MTQATQFTVHADGMIVRDHKILGRISLDAKTGKRRLKHNGQVHDMTHIFHTPALSEKLEEIFGR